MKLCGIDEAGRGPLAGPLVFAGVVLSKPIDGLADSKKLSQKKREFFYEEIIQNSIYKIIFTNSAKIDKDGLSSCISNSLEELKEFFLDYDILFDGNSNYKVEGIRTLIKADTLIAEVSAASILAKVSRDRYMTKVDDSYPEYGFAKHKGYGTKMHRDAILKYGVCPLHRMSFLKNILVL
ncbi:MAG: Ribonuclease HII (EC [uncultured Campylobacterales bacterium]|uniref:Ribonuclease HII n=1 Tax=uncultured Campylobacterales bacterium TaxID=352960 RepID=A0A6S6SEH0_9BACT|nr:MAG: Ribonuclease HII (EC [uncultured Campylobacterales bacterium]